MTKQYKIQKKSELAQCHSGVADTQCDLSIRENVARGGFKSKKIQNKQF